MSGKYKKSENSDQDSDESSSHPNLYKSRDPPRSAAIDPEAARGGGGEEEFKDDDSLF